MRPNFSLSFLIKMMIILYGPRAKILDKKKPLRNICGCVLCVVYAATGLRCVQLILFNVISLFCSASYMFIFIMICVYMVVDDDVDETLNDLVHLMPNKVDIQMERKYIFSFTIPHGYSD